MSLAETWPYFLHWSDFVPYKMMIIPTVVYHMLFELGTCKDIFTVVTVVNLTGSF
jgi:hypothetical protein